MKKAKNLDKYVTGAVNTSCGWAYLIAGEAGVMACIWPLAEEDLVAWEDGHDHCHRIHEEFQKNLIILKDGRSADKRDVEKNDDAVLKQAAEALLAYFSGNFAPLVNVEIDSRNLSLWQRMVYRVVRSIPRDEVRSYKWVAVECGKPGAARAVGQALAVNPTPLFVPCHRVVHSDGCTGNFTSRGKIPGAVLKRLLLQWEKGDGCALDEISRLLREDR
ncbi:methylated-DNA--[protein]-cysteine S-methyltransferase [Syntrophaceticus schinkii]|jgi:methylated-DNA-[protein]-cysteine S-methyltransferase|uniref:Putative Methylated-DNA--(Protein)-cysteine S-methyltransferase n=1 Tax=Syntrophaceticus schinkii TaxID=499207 RepID=A0A0B7MCN6_9FIRM|nr:MGMT family protein [Syntrophaceticus schinkii]CEO88294.1 putative Methylated-DNA--(protein)-cysteine S-methyltransferase [Syntrophaceticus schinkii]